MLTLVKRTISERSDAHILNERLHYLVLVRHVCHHMGHIVVGGAHQRGTEHDGQVPRFHLVKKKQKLKNLLHALN